MPNPVGAGTVFGRAAMFGEVSKKVEKAASQRNGSAQPQAAAKAVAQGAAIARSRQDSGTRLVRPRRSPSPPPRPAGAKNVPGRRTPPPAPPRQETPPPAFGRARSNGLETNVPPAPLPGRNRGQVQFGTARDETGRQWGPIPELRKVRSQHDMDAIVEAMLEGQTETFASLNDALVGNAHSQITEEAKGKFKVLEEALASFAFAITDAELESRSENVERIRKDIVAFLKENPGAMDGLGGRDIVMLDDVVFAREVYDAHGIEFTLEDIMLLGDPTLMEKFYNENPGLWKQGSST